MGRSEIEDREAKLRLAQLANDVEALDGLLADGLQFVFMDGSVYGKKDDLAMHRARAMVFDRIDLAERVISEFGDTVVVTVKAEVWGRMGEAEVRGVYRYCRTWKQLDGRWQVIGGSVAQLSNPS